MSSMEVEQKQAQLMQEFLNKASTLNGFSLCTLIVEATSHPSLFSFSELLALPNLLQVLGTENSAYVDLLRLFAYGTWRDFQSNPSIVPQLTPDQVLKLKQLTVLTLAKTNKVLSYDKLLDELEVSNVRELEDFLINECVYVGIVKGKLDQLRRCFKVEFAAGRDLMHEQLGNVIDTLTNWLTNSDNLLSLIHEKIEWADKMCELEKNHQEEVKDGIERAKKSMELMKLQNRNGHYGMWPHEDVFSGFNDGSMDYDDDDFSRSKRRRPPHPYRQRSRHY